MERTFLYHAHATAAGGQITLPFKEIIEVQAPSALPVTGGHSTSRVENFRYKDILSFRSASTTTTGSFSESDQTFATLVTSTIEGLNILGVVTADVIVARLTSKHPKDGGEPSIIPLGSHFENLRIAGRMVDVELDSERFVQTPTYSGLRTLLTEDQEFHARLSLGQPELATRPPNSTLLCSLVKQVTPDAEELQLEGHNISVPQFGSVHLAEFLISPNSRSLTMVRAVMGSAVKGILSIGHVSGNGEGYPP